MAHRKPFTPRQRGEAVLACHSYRQHLYGLRRDYPPANDEQRRVVADYSEAIKEMAAELRKPDRLVDPPALSQSDMWARWLAMEYWRLKSAEH